jgi:ABC-type lipoprotein release transport system permease subunit
MGAVRRVASGLRPGLLGATTLIVIVMGIAGGLATGFVSGGVHSRTAVDRLIAQTHVPDVMLIDPTITNAQADEVRRLPGVDGASLLVGFGMIPRSGQYINIVASADGRYGIDLDVPNIVRGRAVAPDSAHEVVLSEKIANALGVDVGDVLHFQSYAPEQVASWAGRDATDEELADFGGPDVDLEVVGVNRHPADLTSDDPLSYFTTLPRGFYDEYHGRIGEFFRFEMLDIGEHPSAARVGAVIAAAQRVGGDDSTVDEAGEQQGGPLVSTLDFVGMSMMVLGGIIALAGLIVGALFVSRTVARAAFESAPLVAIGMTNTERALAITIALAPAAIIAGALTAAFAVLSTAFLPFGLARRADPRIGLRLDLVPVVLGGAATIVLVVATVAVLAFREIRRKNVDHVRRNGVVARLAAFGMPVGPLVGVDLAVGSGRIGSATGNHFAAAAVAMASAAGVGALVLGASTAHLETTPAAYGWTWDYVVPDAAADSLADDAAVDQLAVVVAGAISLDGRPVVVRGMESIKGAPPVLITDGRPPGNGEIVLGRRTMADLGVGIGDTVDAQGSEGSRRMRLVGEAIFAGVIDVPEASWGAAMQASDFEALGVGNDSGSGAVVGLAEGVDRKAFAQRIESQLGDQPSSAEEPVELARLREIEALPWILTGFLILLGLVAVVNAVLTTTRRRARHLAVLRSIGLSPTGVRHAVTIQSVVLALIGLVIGVPLGLVVGHILWRALAGSLGVVVLVDVPWPAILAIAAAGTAAAAVLAIAPARVAARRSIAEALRTE